MVFGGKKQLLEDEIAELKEQNRKKDNVMKELRSAKANVDEQFADIAAGRAQILQHMEETTKSITEAKELVENNNEAAESVHRSMMKVNNAVESFDATHSVFLGQLKQQNETMSVLLEQHRGYAPVAEEAVKIKETMQQSQEEEKEMIAQMKEFSKNMGVLALDAAIEAGRMGESGLKFVEAAEEVRTFSEKYETAAAGLAEKKQETDALLQQFEEQIQNLNTQFKECTKVIGKLYSGAVQTLSAYEGGQINLHETVAADMVGGSDVLKVAGEEFLKLQGEISAQLHAVQEELEEQKKNTDELETIFLDLQQAADQI